MAVPLKPYAGLFPSMSPSLMSRPSFTSSSDVLVEWTPLTSSQSRNQPSVPANPTFHHFSRLPPEIRAFIWVLATPNERVVELRSWGNHFRRPYRPIKFSAGPHSTPPILHVNQESRQEGLRRYQIVELGVSVAALDPDRTYVSWEYHPENPHALPNYTRRPPQMPLAWPHRPQKIYLDFSRDVIYLGPEFQLKHLSMFLSATGTELELPGLQYLALDRKLWLGCLGPMHVNHQETQQSLQQGLYALHSRPIKEVYIIPDDIVGSLTDKYYYGKHDLHFEDPPLSYEHWSGRFKFGPPSKTFIENLDSWFARLWSAKGLAPPTVRKRSVRRNGLSMGDYESNVWEIQRKLSDMRFWQNWTPPDDS